MAESDGKRVHPKDAKTATNPDERWENLIAIAIVVILCIAALWWIYLRWHPSSAPQDDTRATIPLGHAPMVGSGNASVVVVEFSDFECLYCGTFAREQFPLVKRRYIDTGDVEFAYLPFPLVQSHPDAMAAAQAGLCADMQGKFWEYHDMLYAHQDALRPDNLTQYAGALGLNLSAFSECVSFGLTQPDIAQYALIAKNAGVTGTPTFFFNGRRVVGMLSADEFGKEVEKEKALKQ
jgi:protein-disulfide isomerase